MTDYERTYEKLKSIDPDLADEYLLAGIQCKALTAILTEVRKLVLASPGESVISALKRALGSLEEVEKTPVPEIIKKPIKKRISQAVSKEERQNLIERMSSLGLEYSSKDSYRRMLARVEKAESCEPTDSKVNFQFTKEETLTTIKEEDFDGKKKAVVTGW